MQIVMFPVIENAYTVYNVDLFTVGNLETENMTNVSEAGTFYVWKTINTIHVNVEILLS